MNELKIENMNGVIAPNAPMNQVEIKTEVEDTSKDTQKATEEQTEKATQKHVVTYIGSSEFTDSTGHKWYKNDEKTYDEDEYATRNDLHFMIKYGEMKHTIVTM